MILIICNPHSGGNRAKKVLQLLEEFCRQHKLEHVVYLTQKPADHAGMRQIFNQHVYRMVVSCGGDGNAHDVLNALYATQNPTPLLVLPAGSGNDYSTQLYGKSTPAELFPMLKQSKTGFTDVGQCNNLLFINGIGIGFDGDIAQKTASNKNRWLPTWLKYYTAILKNVIFYKEQAYNINGKPNEKAFMIAAANGHCYGGGFKIAPGALLNDGLLNVVIIGKLAAFLRPFYIPIVQKGKHLNMNIVEHFTTEKVEITTVANSPLPAHADGECFAAEKFTIQVLRAYLPVVLPV